MAALTKTLPKVPFFFRIYSEDNQGIVYEATKQISDSAFNCTGSRPIGECQGKKVWLLGGYMDVMPDAAMHDIIASPNKLSSVEIAKIVKDAGLGASVKNMTCYSDEHGYWFCKNCGQSKSNNNRNSNSRNANVTRQRNNSKRSRNGNRNNGKRNNSKRSRNKNRNNGN